MNTSLTLDYTQKVLGSLSFKKRFLAWDSYECHMEPSVSNDLKVKKFESAIIPGGCTKYVQAPDVSWNKPFKALVSENYDEWLSTVGINQLTESGNLKSPTRKVIVELILNAWEKLDKELIIKSFKTCSLNLPIDGSEDENIHCLKQGQPCHAGLELLKSQQEILHEKDINPFELIIDQEDIAAAAPVIMNIDDNDDDIEIEIDV